MKASPLAADIAPLTDLISSEPEAKVSARLSKAVAKDGRRRRRRFDDGLPNCRKNRPVQSNFTDGPVELETFPTGAQAERERVS
jgi:hypothetical protein